jgi:outer membrane receptor protein involved in Fe transport
MNLRKSPFMKINKFIRIIYAAIFYLFFEVMVQIFFIPRLYTAQIPDNKDLQDVKVKISGENISLEQTFQLIEQQTDYKFFYVKEDVPLNEKVNQQDGSLYQILQSLAKEYGLAFNRINNQIVIKKIAIVQTEMYKVNGIVRDGSTKEPLIFANIIVDGAQQGTSTDANGKFTLMLTRDTVNLRCSYIGYKTEIIPISLPMDVPLTISLFSMDMLLQDVTVYAHQDNEANQEEMSVLTLQSETIKQTTGQMADVLRSVQMLPGVSSNNELSARFNVHGGDANENLVLINGTQVYEPYHFKEAPNASVGIFDVNMIKKMDLTTGGFSARYGDRMSSVLSIDYREGDKDRLKGQASLSITDFDALLEGPIGENGSFIIGTRQSYMQYILKMLDVAPQVHMSFYDVQGVLAYQLAPQHKMSLKFIHAGDAYVYDPTVNSSDVYTNSVRAPSGAYGSLSESWRDSSEEHAHYYSSMIALQSVNVISSELLLKSEVSYYNQRESGHSRELDLYGNLWQSGLINAFYKSISNEMYDNDLQIQTLEINSSIEIQAASFYGIRTGANYQRIFYDRRYIDRKTIEEITNQTYWPDTIYSVRDVNQIAPSLDSIRTQSHKVGGYIENVLQLGDHVIFNVGARFDYFDLNKELTWSPRIMFAYKVNAALTLRGAWGHYYQSPIYQQLASSIASDTNTQSQRAVHYVLGAECNLIANAETHSFIKLKIEGYHKTYNNLISSAFSTNWGIIEYSRKNDAIGMSSGVDAYIMYSASGLSGWISYSLLKAEQKMMNDTLGYFPMNTDQQHTIASVLDFDMGNAWSANIRLTYGSGYPYTPSIAIFNQSKNAWEWHAGNPNSAYIPAYKRIDFRISKNFKLFGLPTSAFLDISNAFNFNNIQTYSYKFDEHGQPKISEVKLWPILPSLGITVRF